MKVKDKKFLLFIELVLEDCISIKSDSSLINGLKNILNTKELNETNINELYLFLDEQIKIYNEIILSKMFEEDDEKILIRYEEHTYIYSFISKYFYFKVENKLTAISRKAN